MGKLNHQQVHFNLFAQLTKKKPKKNAGNGISETLDLKMFCKSMPPDFLVWTAFTARYYLLVRSQKKFHATPGGCQLLDRYNFTM